MLQGISKLIRLYRLSIHYIFPTISKIYMLLQYTFKNTINSFKVWLDRWSAFYLVLGGWQLADNDLRNLSSRARSKL